MPGRLRTLKPCYPGTRLSKKCNRADCLALTLCSKRVFGLVIDFGTSQSPKSTRPLTDIRRVQGVIEHPGAIALVPQPSWSPSTTQQLQTSSLLLRTWLPMTGRRVWIAYLWHREADRRQGSRLAILAFYVRYMEVPFYNSGAMRTTGKQCGLAATGVYQPSLRSPWLAALVVGVWGLNRKEAV